MRLLGLVGLAVAVAAAQVTVTREMRQSLPLRSEGMVRVEHQYGNVTVSGTQTESVVVRAVVRVHGADSDAVQGFARGVIVSLLPQGETVLVQTVYPAARDEDSSLGYETDIEVDLPERAGLDVENRFGDVLVGNVQGPGRLENRYGNIEAEECGPCDVVSWYGDVMLVGPEAARIEHRFGRLVLERPTGDVSVNSQYAEIEAELGDAALSLLDIVSLAGRVELSLDEESPFRLSGLTQGGRINTDLPLLVTDSAGARIVFGSKGAGGPAIDLKGSSSDIVIRGRQVRLPGRR